MSSDGSEGTEHRDDADEGESLALGIAVGAGVGAALGVAFGGALAART